MNKRARRARKVRPNIAVRCGCKSAKQASVGGKIYAHQKAHTRTGRGSPAEDFLKANGSKFEQLRWRGRLNNARVRGRAVKGRWCAGRRCANMLAQEVKKGKEEVDGEGWEVGVDVGSAVAV